MPGCKECHESSSLPKGVCGIGEGACLRASRFLSHSRYAQMKKSALLFVLKGTSFIAKHEQTRPAFQTQIGLSPSHTLSPVPTLGEPGGYKPSLS
ncbi:hypothetical protein I79_014034 [Cricetulus griseus]|uniref:Uncharacterized protein n=1 Tax=Cricetulus griseus TaxID=10029 RepID=G3HT21_CRIGR|nr:hypothetical protein I79_014034 [Cricetulus griseus]